MCSQEADPASPPSRDLILTMVNRRGLHARAAAKFVQTAEQFNCTITVSKDGHSVSGRSIMGLLMLAATLGSAIEVKLCGKEAGPAADAIEALVSNGFGEAE